jgi:UDP:flavonoid glycosyltransferase YjiC (YdhE family)
MVMQEIACFITPHGFGHATRMIAVLEALQREIPDLHPHLYTTVPESLFAETLGTFSYHPLSCDIGLIQKNGLQADLPATINRLQDFLPFKESLVNELAGKIQGFKLVLCDIAPIGIAVAREAGITSVLIENFTWDWIYKAYLSRHPELQPAISYLASQYRLADVHIRCKPCCGPAQGDLECGPVFRRIRTKRTEMRKKLHCKNKKMVLISMGGVDLELPFIHQLPASSDTFFILAGQKKTCRLAKNTLLLARDSNYYHPDLINSADLVICKSGYSTIAECAQAGVPIVTVGRTSFPESAPLEQFSITQLNGHTLEQTEFLSGSWLKNLNKLSSTHHKPAPSTNGADAAAKFLCKLFS